ncbi:hypothetical protein D3C72_2039510 [compost metagenome]
MSAPALKSLSPAPISRITRASPSPHSQCTASGIARHIAALIAFLRSALAIRRMPVPAWLAARIMPAAKSWVRFIWGGPFMLIHGSTI